MQTGILDDLTDFHSHILPAVDDGIKSKEEALKVLDAYEALNIRKVVFTPHVMEEFPLNNASFLRERFDLFRQSYSGGVQLSLAAEYMLDNRFKEHLESGDLLTLKDNFILLETAIMSPLVSFTERLADVREKGYTVVLAHPERYIYMRTGDYQQLKRMGILFQLNLLSILGGYGKEVERNARVLLYGGYYDLIGTDIHQLNYHMQKFTHGKLSRKDTSHLCRLKQKGFTV